MNHLTMCRRVAGIGISLALPGLMACATRHVDVMSWEQYSRTRHGIPYRLEVDADAGALSYFGARHMGEMVGHPIHPQTEDIERAWSAFRPDVAFYEGRSTYGASLPDVTEAATRAGESGVVNFLAARDRVPAHSLEPTLDEEVAGLRRTFTAEQIRLFYILRCVSQQCTGPGTADEQVERWLQRTEGRALSLPGPPRSVEEVASSVARLLPHLEDWRIVSSKDRDPVPRSGETVTFLNRIAQRSSALRDEHMVQTLTKWVRDGHRVFAVVGASHVVMQEPAFRQRGFRVTRTP